MRNGRVSQRDADHATFGIISAFANGISNFPGFAQAKANLSLFVTHDDQGTKTKAAAAFHHLSRAVNEDHFFAEIASFLAIAPFVGCLRGPASAAPSLTSAASATAPSRWKITSCLIGHNLSWFRIKTATPLREQRRSEL